MKHFLATALMAAAAALTPMTAAAQTPPEVMKPYKAYLVAFEGGDMATATKLAAKAYKEGLKRIPDAPVMAALAENYADLLQLDDPEGAFDVYELALDVMPDDGTENVEHRADLMLKAAKTFMYVPIYSKSRLARADRFIEKTQDYINANGLTDTTLGAEVLVMSAWADMRRGKRKPALEKVERAEAIFEGPNHAYFSPLEYQGKLIAGAILNREDKPIEAALVLQEVMQNLEGELDVKHPFIKDAFSKWLWSRNLIADADLTEDALQAGVCKCWPYDEISASSPIAKRRVPPSMPRNAKRSGRVMLKFDVGTDGKPTNVEAVAATEEFFIRPAVKSVYDWEYDVSDLENAEGMKGVVSSIVFRLATTSGKLIEEPELKPVEEL